MTHPSTTETELSRQVGVALGALLGQMLQYSTQAMLRLMQQADLSMPRMTTLMMLSRCGTASVSDISEHLNLSLGATSHLVDKLVEGGLVTRAEAPDDRRQKHIALTGAGLALADEIKRLRVEEMSRRLADLPEPLLERSLAVLAELQEQLRAGDPR